MVEPSLYVFWNKLSNAEKILFLTDHNINDSLYCTDDMTYHTLQEFYQADQTIESDELRLLLKLKGVIE